MRNWRKLIVALLILVLVGSVSCSAFGGNKQQTSQQLVKVVRGDLTVTVSGSGNLEASNKANLAFGVGGKVAKIYVDEGDNVIEGEALARLETDDLELALTQTQVAYTQAGVGVTQAQVALETANYNLNQALEKYTWPDIKIVQADIDDAKAYVEYVAWNVAQSTPEKRSMWIEASIYAKARLAATEAKLDAMVRSYDTEEVALQRMQVEAARQSLQLAQQSQELAKKSLDRGQKQLEDTTITAPFAGVIAKVNVDEGDIVPPPGVVSKTIIDLIDPTGMELVVEVDEIDVVSVKLGQRADIEVDALPALKLEGKVSFINLLPTNKAGVVVYDLRIVFSVAEGTGLRDGMSATADIVVAERNNVLLVPDRSIKRDSQGKTTVQVVLNGQTEERSVATGISDGFNTEIVDGLREGEMVVEAQTRSASSGVGILQQ